jgi:hypothetical protein
MELQNPVELLPDKQIKIPLSWLIYVVILVASLSVGYGGFRAGYLNQVSATEEAKKEVVALRSDLNDLRYELGRLKQSVDDLRETMDRKK